MPREISFDAMRSMLAQSTSEVFLELLELDHVDLGEPFRFCNNAVAIVSNGNTYEPHAFFAELPADAEDQEPRCTLTISNVGRELISFLRSLSGRPQLVIAVVTASDPDTYQFDPHPFEVITVRGDAQTLVLEMVFSEFIQEVFPKYAFSPVHFPSLHSRTA